MDRRTFLTSAGLTGAALLSGGLGYTLNDRSLAAGPQPTAAGDPPEGCFSGFDYQTLIAQSVTSIKGGAGSRFPQSAAVHTASGKYYIARQTTGNYQDQMIYEYDLATGALLRSKDVPMGTGVYLEGLVYFSNAAGQLCFIVPVQKYGKFGIFNFETGLMETQFNMNGNYKIGFDNRLKYFLCGKNAEPAKDANTSMDGVYLYDLASVIAGQPVLAGTVEFLHDQMFNHKIQGLTMIDDVIYLGQGAEYQTISMIDMNGNLLHMVSYDSKELISLVGGNPGSTNLQVESEGMTWVKVNGVTHPVAFIATQGKACLIKLGDTAAGTKISRQIFKGYNPLREHAALQLIQSSGTPSVYVTTGADFYQAVASIKRKGIYTFFCNGSAMNAPIGGRSIRGTIIVTDVTSAGVASLAEIRGQDYGGIVWSNYYDTNASDIWKGWSNIGGAFAVQAGSSFDPFTANPGVYETTSATNAPVNDSAIKIYTITRSYQGRRQLQCNYSESGNVYYGNIHTNGVFKGWKKVAFAN